MSTSQRWWDSCVGSFVTVPFGAHVAHHTRVIVLERVFAVVLFTLAAKMLLSLL